MPLTSQYVYLTNSRSIFSISRYIVPALGRKMMCNRAVHFIAKSINNHVSGKLLAIHLKSTHRRQLLLLKKNTTYNIRKITQFYWRTISTQLSVNVKQQLYSSLKWLVTMTWEKISVETSLVSMYNRNNIYHTISQIKIVKLCVLIFILMKILNQYIN